jgi:heme exporter protein B
MTDHRANQVNDKPLLPVLTTIFKHELMTAFQNRQQLVNPLIFFVLVLLLFPLGVDPSPQFLSAAAPGLIWVAVLLSSMLSLGTLFKDDLQDGSLEQWLVSGQPLYFLVLFKTIVHWLYTGLPIVLFSPLLALMLHFPMDNYSVLVLSLLLGSPVIALLGGIGAALTVSLRSGGILVSLLILPLTIPVLIFGTGMVLASIDGVPFMGQLALLASLFFLALTLCPLASAAALKMSVLNS